MYQGKQNHRLYPGPFLSLTTFCGGHLLFYEKLLLVPHHVSPASRHSAPAQRSFLPPPFYPFYCHVPLLRHTGDFLSAIVAELPPRRVFCLGNDRVSLSVIAAQPAPRLGGRVREHTSAATCRSCAHKAARLQSLFP